jgi:hypothetical protein
MVGADAGAETDATVWDEDIRCKVGTCALKEVDDWSAADATDQRAGREGCASTKCLGEKRTYTEIEGRRRPSKRRTRI